MKKATSDTRIRMRVDLHLGAPENVTMSAAAWNALSSILYQAAQYAESKGCGTVASGYKDVSDYIYNMLEMRGYYND